MLALEQGASKLSPKATLSSSLIGHWQFRSKEGHNRLLLGFDYNTTYLICRGGHSGIHTKPMVRSQSLSTRPQILDHSNCITFFQKSGKQLSYLSHRVVNCSKAVWGCSRHWKGPGHLSCLHELSMVSSLPTLADSV